MCKRRGKDSSGASAGQDGACRVNDARRFEGTIREDRKARAPNGDQAHGDDDPGTQTTTVAAVAPQLACMAQGAAIARAGAPMLAIAKTVADWYEQYCDLAARVGFEPEII